MLWLVHSVLLHVHVLMFICTCMYVFYRHMHHAHLHVYIWVPLCLLYSLEGGHVPVYCVFFMCMNMFTTLYIAHLYTLISADENCPLDCTVHCVFNVYCRTQNNEGGKTFGSIILEGALIWNGPIRITYICTDSDMSSQNFGTH